MANEVNDFWNSKPIMPEQQAISTEFKPNPRKGQNGVFNAVVRFLPNPTDPGMMSIIAKNVVYLEHPITKTRRAIDCPTSIGQSSPLTTTFFALRNSNNPVLQANADKFSRKQQYVSLIQVIDCKSDPSLVNKILVWKYGSKVHDKLKAEMNPASMGMMGEPKEPFNIITGRPFAVVVKEVSNFPNYDGCNFFDLNIAQSGMRILVKDAQGNPTWTIVNEQLISTPQGKELVFNYLKENTPDMEKYKYHDWTADDTKYVNECIQIYSNPTASIKAASASQNQMPTQVPQQNMAAQAAMTPQMGMPNPASMPQMPQVQAMPPIQTPTNQMSQPQMPQMPAMGITDIAGTSNVGTGFQMPQMSDDINSLIGGTNNNTGNMAGPTLNLQLDEILGDQTKN